MDQKSLETLARLKEKMKAKPSNDEPPKGHLSAENFELLAGCLGVSGYEHLKPKKNRLSCEPRETKPPAASHEPPFDMERTARPKRSDWIKSNCIICRAEFAYLPEWKRKPVLCKGCRAERKGGRRKGKERGKAPTQPVLQQAKDFTYTHASPVQGGSPGLGKRK